MFPDIYYLKQRLVFNGNELENTKKLLHYNIRKHNEVDLVEKMEILVKLFHQTCIMLYVEASDTIASIKEMIKDREGKFDSLRLSM